MPIGEDIPMLVPISIVLVVFLIFILSLFSNFSEQYDIIKMSQNSILIGDYIVNVKFAAETGKLSLQKLGENFTGCSYQNWSKLNITSNYQVIVNITDIESNKSWCWKNFYKSDAKTSVSNSFPVLLTDGNLTHLGQVKVVVNK